MSAHEFALSSKDFNSIILGQKRAILRNIDRLFAQGDRLKIIDFDSKKSITAVVTFAELCSELDPNSNLVVLSFQVL